MRLHRAISAEKIGVPRPRCGWSKLSVADVSPCVISAMSQHGACARRSSHGVSRSPTLAQRSLFAPHCPGAIGQASASAVRARHRYSALCWPRPPWHPWTSHAPCSANRDRRHGLSWPNGVLDGRLRRRRCCAGMDGSQRAAAGNSVWPWHSGLMSPVSACGLHSASPQAFPRIVQPRRHPYDQRSDAHSLLQPPCSYQTDGN